MPVSSHPSPSDNLRTELDVVVKHLSRMNEFSSSRSWRHVGDMHLRRSRKSTLGVACARTSWFAGRAPVVVVAPSAFRSLQAPSVRRRRRRRRVVVFGRRRLSRAHARRRARPNRRAAGLARANSVQASSSSPSPSWPASGRAGYRTSCAPESVPVPEPRQRADESDRRATPAPGGLLMRESTAAAGKRWGGAAPPSLAVAGSEMATCAISIAVSAPPLLARSAAFAASLSTRDLLAGGDEADSPPCDVRCAALVASFSALPLGSR
jgi:hypothetical protein